MTYMLQATKVNLTEELNSQILTANAKVIDVIGKYFRKRHQKNFPQILV